MAIDALGSNTNNSVLELLKARRDAMKAMEAAVQSGDIKSAQQNLATVQQDTQNIQSATGTSDTQQDTNSYRSVMKTDLSNLMNAVQGGDLGASQSALQTFQQDRAAIAGPSPNDVVSNTSSQTDNLNDLQSLLQASASGDSSGLQNAATALQKDLQSFSDAETSSSTQTADAATATSQPNPFLNDLKALIDAATSKDTAGMQSAAKNLAQDIQNAAGATSSGQVGGHHHHHHHHSVESADATSGTTGSAQTNNSGATAQGDSDGDKDDNGTAATGQSSGSSALKNAQAAYELLMSFSQQTPKVA
jgi:ribosomal protein S20